MEIKYVRNKKQKMLSVFTGVSSGFLNGLFGGGGGMIVVPMLGAINGFEAKNSHATAILIMLPFCVLSGLFYSSSVKVNLTMLLCCTIGVICGGILGAIALKRLASKWVRIIFAIAMFIAGVRNVLF